ncbi:unannotated protein [freshwater metagenome]|uniref:Unannotated protein n=1 Tax=freshwater metagenome TaxID=449393 RepID=A0A6J6RT49_9ZZZZ
MLPVLVALTVALVWLLSVGLAQLRAVDAAREAARASARGEADADVIGRAGRIAPEGAVVTLERTGDTVTARVSGSVGPPGGGLLDSIASVAIAAEAVAAIEGDP